MCGELGALEAELDALESRRAVALDASFHRFGYSAHISEDSVPTTTRWQLDLLGREATS